MRGSRARVQREREEQQRRAAADQRQAERRVRQTIEQVCAELGETEEKPRKQITRAVEICGVEWVLALLAETQQVEAAGGMLTADGARRRTLGGVFLLLLRQKLTDEGRKAELKQIM